MLIAQRLPTDVLCEAQAKNVAVQHGLSRACGVRLGLEVVGRARGPAGAIERAAAAPSPEGALWGLGLALGEEYEVGALNVFWVEGAPHQAGAQQAAPDRPHGQCRAAGA